MSIIDTANSRLTSGATNLAGRATNLASKGGILGKAAGLIGSGLTFFAKMTPVGKAATIAVAALGANSLLNRGSSHPAGQRVG